MGNSKLTYAATIQIAMMIKKLAVQMQVFGAIIAPACLSTIRYRVKALFLNSHFSHHAQQIWRSPSAKQLLIEQPVSKYSKNNALFETSSQMLQKWL